MGISSHIFVVKIVMMFGERPKINDKRGRGWSIFLKKNFTLMKMFNECHRFRIGKLTKLNLPRNAHRHFFRLDNPHHGHQSLDQKYI